MDRRRFLEATGGTATALAIAGCLGEDDDDGIDDAIDETDDEVEEDDEDPLEDDDEDVDEDDTDDEEVDDDDDEDVDEDDDGEVASNVQKAQEAWDRVSENPGPDAEDVRNEAYVEMEEAIRDDMILMPLYHGLSERFWYDWVDIEPMGPLGGHHQQYDDVEIDTDAEHKDDNVLRVINSTISSLDPIESTDTASAEVISQVYECLTDYPAGVTELENQLLEEVEISDDSSTYTFTIKEGVEYHDGEELTAHDFRYAWRRLIEAPASQRASFALDPSTGLGLEHESDEDEGVGPANVVPDSIGVEVVDDYTLEMNLVGPNPAVLEILTYDSFAAVPEGIVDDLEDVDGEVGQEEFATETMNGTGPFEFEEWVPESEARVTRFDGYHDGEANIEAVEWTILEDDDAIWTVANERNVDVFGIPTPFYDQDNVDAEEDDQERDVGTYGPLENGDTVNYVGVSDIATYYIGFNGAQTERAARQAFAYLTDHEELIQQVFQGRGTEAFSFIPPALWPNDVTDYEEWVDEWPYGPNETDRDSATEVMEEAGYSDGDPYSLTLTTYASEVFQEAGRLTRDKASGTGLEIELEEAEFSTLLSRGEDGDLQAYSLGWIWSWTDIAYGMFGFEPANTNTDLIPTEADGYYLDWEEVEPENGGGEDGEDGEDDEDDE